MDFVTFYAPLITRSTVSMSAIYLIERSELWNTTLYCSSQHIKPHRIYRNGKQKFKPQFELWAAESFHGEASFNRGLEPKWQIQSCQYQTHAWNPLDKSLNPTRLSRWSTYLLWLIIGFYSLSRSGFLIKDTTFSCSDLHAKENDIVRRWYCCFDRR